MTNNVIQFPKKPRIDRVNEEIEMRHLEAMNDNDDAVAMAHYMFELMQTGLNQQDWTSKLYDMDFEDRDRPEAHDMFVIINCIASMFLRKLGYNHALQPDLDILYEKLGQMQLNNDIFGDDEYDDFD